MSDQNQTYAEPQASSAIPPIPPTAPPKAPAAPPVPPYDSYSKRPRGGVGFGIFLVTIGVVMLFAQFIPGASWAQLWPLIIVALGLGQMIVPGWGDERGVMRVMDGFGTVLFGLALLGCTLGYVSWSMWWVLLSLWPVLLIAGGIAIIGKGIGQVWMRALAPLVIWAALALAVVSSLTAQAPIDVPASITIHPTTIPFVIINGK